MGRLMRNRVKVQKTDTENSPPVEKTKCNRRAKGTTKALEKEQTKPILAIDIAGPSKISSNTQVKKDCKPVYTSQKKSITRKSVKDWKERLHLYDFEVDENEPVAKKTKRKPILKIKKHRTYKKKVKCLPESSIVLEEVGKENLCPNPTVHTPSKPTKKNNKASIPLAEISNIPIEDNLDLSIEAALPSGRLTSYSPKPYRSPVRNSLNVPVLRTSDCNLPSGNTSSRSLNTSTSSSKHDKSCHSTHSNYSGSFMNRLFMGSSTPIRSHWTEESERCLSRGNIALNGHFDLSNNFGFEADNNFDEPFISPIKSTDISFNTVATPKKQSPVKVPFKRVIKMLKFGWNAGDSDAELSFEGLPNDFYHDGGSPSYSSASVTSTPEHNIKIPLQNCLNKTNKKKQLAFKEDSNDSGNLTQSSEDKEIQEKREVYKNIKNNLKISKGENDKGYETEDQVSKKRQVRRSYERPAYLRSKKKVGPFGLEDDEEDDHEETVSVKVGKKKGGLSKKEEQEMEKWAKAFNEQCMEVQSFNLCVE